jgi:putative lipase involved disintegration of autophagic bodies
LKPQFSAYSSSISRMDNDGGAFETIHPLGGSATQLLARPVGRPALSLLLAGASLPRRRFAPVIPPKRAISRVQLRFQG